MTFELFCKQIYNITALILNDRFQKVKEISQNYQKKPVFADEILNNKFLFMKSLHQKTNNAYKERTIVCIIICSETQVFTKLECMYV